MTDTNEFIPFQKLPRLSRDVIVTEKIDGTNACVYITDDGQVFSGKRTSWCTPERDNHGFARWVADNRDELLKLGPGRHFGEWWGAGIQRGYGLKEKRFSLFNTTRWAGADDRPACVGVVPVLYRGPFDTVAINGVLRELTINGSVAAPGFMDPEGVVIFHSASGTLFKKTIKNDDEPKSVVEARLAKAAQA